jgi:hypothetical protein
MAFNQHRGQNIFNTDDPNSESDKMNGADDIAVARAATAAAISPTTPTQATTIGLMPQYTTIIYLFTLEKIFKMEYIDQEIVIYFVNKLHSTINLNRYSNSNNSSSGNKS